MERMTPLQKRFQTVQFCDYWSSDLELLEKAVRLPFTGMDLAIQASQTLARP